jgi:hypothetical protein
MDMVEQDGRGSPRPYGTRERGLVRCPRIALRSIRGYFRLFPPGSELSSDKHPALREGCGPPGRMHLLEFVPFRLTVPIGSKCAAISLRAPLPCVLL